MKKNYLNTIKINNYSDKFKQFYFLTCINEINWIQAIASESAKTIKLNGKIIQYNNKNNINK